MKLLDFLTRHYLTYTLEAKGSCFILANAARFALFGRKSDSKTMESIVKTLRFFIFTKIILAILGIVTV